MVRCRLTKVGKDPSKQLHSGPYRISYMLQFIILGFSDYLSTVFAKHLQLLFVTTPLVTRLSQ